MATRTDAGANEWTIHDDVVSLRPWGARASYALPRAPVMREWIIGASSACWLPLVDPLGLVSRTHARLVRSGSRWLIEDLASKNGMLVDGARRSGAVLEPGVELGIGGITLIAESPRLIALRGFLERILGWGDDCLDRLDQALRSLRVAATRRAALLVCGDHDLVQLAQALHCRTIGPDRPFIVCDPRRRTAAQNVRSAKNLDEGMVALRAATGGSLCIWASRPPRDFADVQAALRDPGARVQLVICARQPSDVEHFGPAPVSVPAVAARAGELVRIIDEYAADAIDTLGMPAGSFSPDDRDWVVRQAASSLPEIEKATRRLLAIRGSGNLNQAAARLGMARVSLKKWIGHRPLPMSIDG